MSAYTAWMATGECLHCLDRAGSAVLVVLKLTMRVDTPQHSDAASEAGGRTMKSKYRCRLTVSWYDC